MISLRRITPRITTILVLALLATAAGCSGNRASARASRNVSVVIENTTPSFLTIFAVPRSGTRVRVGEAAANQTTTLRFSPVLTGPYRLVAQQLSGVEMVSNDVSIDPGVTIQWNLSSNIAIQVDGPA